MSSPNLKEWVTEGSLEDGDESPDSQGQATDWRFAVCRFRDAWDEEEPAPQVQVKDPDPPRPLAEAAQGEGLQGGPLSGELQPTPGQVAVDGSGDGQGGTLGGSSGKSEEPVPSEVKSLLCLMSSHLSLAQGDSASQGGDLAGDPDSGRVMTTGLDPGELSSDSLNLGGPLSATASQLPEAGKGGWAEVPGKGVGGVGAEVPGLRRGSLDRWAIADPSHFPFQDPSGSSLPEPADYLLAQDLAWELLASGMAALPGSRRDWRWWWEGDLIGKMFTALSPQGLGM